MSMLSYLKWAGWSCVFGKVMLRKDWIGVFKQFWLRCLRNDDIVRVYAITPVDGREAQEELAK